MIKRNRAVVAATMVVIVLLGAGLAAANRSISFSPSGSQRYTGRLTFSEEGGGRASCDLTLTGSIARVVPKARGSIAGAITAGTAGRCVGLEGVPIILFERPWEIIYNEFQGTLPNITGVLYTVEAVYMLVTVFPYGGCLYRAPMGFLQTAAGGLTVLPAVGSLQQDLPGGIFPCPLRINATGAFVLAVNPAMTLL